MVAVMYLNISSIAGDIIVSWRTLAGGRQSGRGVVATPVVVAFKLSNQSVCYCC